MTLKIACLSIGLFVANLGISQQLFTVYFDLDKSILTPTAKSELDKFLYEQKENISTLEIYLAGYCDPRGSGEYNDKLSKRRVSTVKNYLLDNGIPAVAILNEKANGERVQLNENKTEEEMSMNRRVQVSFTTTGASKPEQPGTLTEKIADSATKAGTNIILRNLNFVGGRHQLLDESMPIVEELLDVMRTNPKLVIRIEGHICCQPDNRDGMDLETGIQNLSTARAKAIRDYLVDNGIQPDRVSYTGFGHSAPIHPYPEQTDQERIENRRVEIKIITK